MLRFVDILNIPESDYKNYKVHLATGSKDKTEPYQKFLINAFQEWQEHQTQKNFSRKYVISLIYYDKDKWLFGGVYEVLPKKPVPIRNGNWSGWRYYTKLTDCQTDMIGRLFVNYKRDFRSSYLNLEMKPKKDDTMALRDAYIESILDKPASINDFSGFDQVNINYETLKMIVSNQIMSWKAALSKVKGVYLIVDQHTGKQYVGSASGDDCIWQRWLDYAKNGHGGNVELQKLLEKNGEKYKYNFKYSILEICNMNLGSEYILDRESYWKEVLLTREFGLNRN